MAKKAKLQETANAVAFTEYERERYLYKTAEEMRAINDRVDSRYRKQMPEHEHEANQ